jgi:hypothetical protein
MDVTALFESGNLASLLVASLVIGSLLMVISGVLKLVTAIWQFRLVREARRSVAASLSVQRRVEELLGLVRATPPEHPNCRCAPVNEALCTCAKAGSGEAPAPWCPIHGKGAGPVRFSSVLWLEGNNPADGGAREEAQ